MVCGVEKLYTYLQPMAEQRTGLRKEGILELSLAMVGGEDCQVWAALQH